MQNARLDEAQARNNLPGEISITSGMQMTPPLCCHKSKEEIKSLWMKVKVESEKVGLKLNIKKKKKTQHSEN